LVFLLVFAATPSFAQVDDAVVDQIEQGALLYHSLCTTCHGEEGAGVQGIDFGRGRYKRVSSAEDFIRLVNEGISGTAMPPFNIRRRETENLFRYIQSLSETVTHASAAGDAPRGQAIFEGKGGCLNCHRIQNKGSRLGPSLTAIGKVRAASMLQQSLLEPQALVLADHWFCKAVTRDGTTITGRRLNEDRNTVQLIDAQQRLISLNKAELREYAVIKTSAMQSFKDKLSPEEVTDVVKYLTTLKGFDASSAEASAPAAQH
jgi:putative heme-binding domain-containing protein